MHPQNNNVMVGNMNGGNMMGTGGMAMPTPIASSNDDFGDFAGASSSASSAAKLTMMGGPTSSSSSSGDPMSKLINLDGLSMNPSKSKPGAKQAVVGNPVAVQYQQNLHQGIQPSGTVAINALWFTLCNIAPSPSSLTQIATLSIVFQKARSPPGAAMLLAPCSIPLNSNRRRHRTSAGA